MTHNYTTTANAIANNNSITTERKISHIESKRYKAKCAFPHCGKKVESTDGARIVTPSHPRGLTVCTEHLAFLNAIDIFTYSQENTEHVGKQTAKGITTSFELESINNTQLSLASMVCDLGFNATHDCTLYPHGIEHKSPIFDSLQGCTKTLGTIEYLNSIGAFDTTADCCGGHMHTGFYGDVIDFTSLYETIEDYMDVFGGLYAYLDAMPNNKMIEYFGRGYTNYARTIRKDRHNHWYMPCHDGNGHIVRDERIWLYETDYMDKPIFNRPVTINKVHACIFNLQHTYSLEFRLPKFINATQYRHCILTMQNLVSVLRDNNFHNCSEALVDVFRKAFPY